MARVPTAPAQNVRINVPSTFIEGPRLRATAQLANIFEGIAKDGFGFHEERKIQRENESYAVDVSGLGQEIQDIGQEVLIADDIASITSQYDIRSSEALATRLEAIEDSGQRDRLRVAGEKLIAGHRLSVDSGQFEREQVAGRIALNDNLQNLVDQIVDAPNEAVRDFLLTEGIAWIEESSFVLKENEAQAISQFSQMIDLKSISSLVEQADLAEDAVSAQQFIDAAEEILADPTAMLDIKDGKKADLRAAVRVKEQQLVKKFNRGRALDLSRTIAAATTSEDFGRATAEINLMLEDGVITDPQAISFDSRLRARAGLVQSSFSGADKIAVARARGIGIDPEDREDYDAYYDEIFTTQTLAGLEGPDQMREILILIAEADMLPDAIIRSFETAALHDDAESIASLSIQFDEIRKVSPQAIRDLDKNTRILYENINESIKAGISEKDSLERQRDIEKLDPIIRNARKKDHGLFQDDLSDGEWLEQNAADSFEIEKPGFFTRNPEFDEVDFDQRAVFSSSVLSFFILDPNIDRSRARALESMSQVFGTTEVGGQRRNTYLPPEKFYQFGGDSVAITRQVVKQIKNPGEGLNIPDVKGISEKDLMTRIMLVADSQSSREFNLDTKKLEPQYNVYLLSDDEDVAPLLLTFEDLTAVRFLPEDGSTVEKKEMEKVLASDRKNENIENAKVRHVSAMSVKQAEETLRIAKDIPNLAIGEGIGSDDTITNSVFSKKPQSPNAPGF